MTRRKTEVWMELQVSLLDSTAGKSERYTKWLGKVVRKVTAELRRAHVICLGAG